MLNGSAKSNHAAFQLPRDPLQAGRQMKLSIAVLAFLSLAIGLGASAISPHTGWIDGAATPHRIFDSLVDARGTAHLPQG